MSELEPTGRYEGFIHPPVPENHDPESLAKFNSDIDDYHENNHRVRRRVFLGPDETASSARNITEQPKLYVDTEGNLGLGSAEDIRKANAYRELVGGPSPEQMGEEPPQLRIADTADRIGEKIDAKAMAHVNIQPDGQGGEVAIKKTELPHETIESDELGDGSKVTIIEMHGEQTKDDGTKAETTHEIDIKEIPVIEDDGGKATDIEVVIDGKPMLAQDFDAVEAAMHIIEMDVDNAPVTESEPEQELEQEDEKEAEPESLQTEPEEIAEEISEKPVEEKKESTPEAQTKDTEARGRKVSQNLGGFFSPGSAGAGQKAIAQLAAEWKVDGNELMDRLQKGDVTVSKESTMALQRLLREGAKPGSAVWSENLASRSMLGNAARESHQLLSTTLRELLKK